MGRITLISAKDIVESIEYKKLLEEISQSVKIKIVGAYDKVLSEFDDELIDISGIKREDIITALKVRGKDILSYSINKFHALDDSSLEQEYRKGEEPESEENIDEVTEGYCLGFLIMNTLEFLLLEKGYKELLEFLKLARIPKAASYAKKLKEF